MPAAILRILPVLFTLAAIAGAALWIDHAGQTRAKAQAEHERLVTAILIEQRARQLERDLGAQFSTLDHTLTTQLARIDTVNNATIRPIIEREIRDDPRLSDPAAGIDDRLRRAINTAIRQSACPARATGASCATLPAAP